MLPMVATMQLPYEQQHHETVPTDEFTNITLLAVASLHEE